MMNQRMRFMHHKDRHREIYFLMNMRHDLLRFPAPADLQAGHPLPISLLNE